DLEALQHLAPQLGLVFGESLPKPIAGVQPTGQRRRVLAGETDRQDQSRPVTIQSSGWIPRDRDAETVEIDLVWPILLEPFQYLFVIRGTRLEYLRIVLERSPRLGQPLTHFRNEVFRRAIRISPVIAQHLPPGVGHLGGLEAGVLGDASLDVANQFA